MANKLIIVILSYVKFILIYKLLIEGKEKFNL